VLKNSLNREMAKKMISEISDLGAFATLALVNQWLNEEAPFFNPLLFPGFP
jgi:hypothetical protein